MKIHKPNDEGSTMCVVRWQVETPNGWIGAWDYAALDSLVSKSKAFDIWATKAEPFWKNCPPKYLGINVIDAMLAYIKDLEAEVKELKNGNADAAVVEQVLNFTSKEGAK